MKIEFFEYKEDCKEFRILKKAISEFATRKEVKTGKLLFDKIYLNILLIDYKIGEIEKSIVNTNLSFNSRFEKKLKELGLENMELKYEDNTNKIINQDRSLENQYFEGDVLPSIEYLSSLLDFDFDYEAHKNKIFRLEEKEKNGNISFIEEMGLQFYRRSFKSHIEIILKYYSRISLKLSYYFAAYNQA